MLFFWPWTSRAAEFTLPRAHPSALWVWAASEGALYVRKGLLVAACCRSAHSSILLTTLTAPGADNFGDDSSAGRNPPARVLDAVFNLSMTYQRDSDVLFDYGRVVEKAAEAAPRNKQPSLEATLRVWFARKTRLAAWTASHCETASKRELLVASLRRTAPVDVFGKCGGLWGVLGGAGHARHADLLSRKYMFYLAFENRLCRDYITEKFWIDALLNTAIPLVLGGGTRVGARSDYHEVAPPGSFIDAEDFPSARELADHLKEVARNFTLFASYHAWRANYSLAGASGDWAHSREAEARAACGLCGWLHGHGHAAAAGGRAGGAGGGAQSRWELNLTRFWSEAGSCRPPTHFGVTRPP